MKPSQVHSLDAIKTRVLIILALLYIVSNLEVIIVFWSVKFSIEFSLFRCYENFILTFEYSKMLTNKIKSSKAFFTNIFLENKDFLRVPKKLRKDWICNFV